MRFPRREATYTLLEDGRVLAAGGTILSLARDPDQPAQEYIPVTEIFDPSRMRWFPGPDLSVSRSQHTVTTLRNGNLLAAGGIGIYGVKGEAYPLVSSEIIETTPKTPGTP